MLGCAASPARAQFIGFTSPQTVQATLAPAGTACTGSSQKFNPMNLGQTQHSAVLVFTGSVTSAILQIVGTDTANHTFPISAPAQAGAVFPSSSISANVTASGYYPIISVTVTCSVGSTFTLTYSGTSSTPPIVGGTSFTSLIDQQIFTSLSVSGSSTSSGQIFQTPFGNSSGILEFAYPSSPVSGSSISVQCTSNASNAITAYNHVFVFFPASTTSFQEFRIPPSNCPLAQVIYTNGGTSGVVTAEYNFDNQGMIPNPTMGTYTHITGTTATEAKGSAGVLTGVTVNTSAAGTISVFDLGLAACTGTPATNTVAVITAIASSPPVSLPYNLSFQNGICVKASATMDITVSSQ